MTSDPIYAAILVNYNAGPELERALRSISDELAGQPWEGVVIDNASIDDSAAAIDAFAAHVRLVRNEANVGFATVNCEVTSAPAKRSVMEPACTAVLKSSMVQVNFESR